MSRAWWTEKGRAVSRVLRPSILLAPLLASGCELTQITTPPGEDLLVVEAVLRAGETRQEVLLHRTLVAGTVRGEPQARVVLRNSGGPEVVLEERPMETCTGAVSVEETDSLDVVASCYSTRSRELEVRPGERYELRIETRRGEVVRGQTQVPGDFDLRVPHPARHGAACSLPPGTRMEVIWSSASGAWSYLAGIQVVGLRNALSGSGIQAPDILELTGVAVSEMDTAIVVPSDLGIFERFGANQDLLRVLQNGFPSGVSMDMVVSAVDRNFVNSVRGGRFNPSGNVRISSVVGDGIGTFGSLVPRRFFVRVSEDPGELPSCVPG